MTLGRGSRATDGNRENPNSKIPDEKDSDRLHPDVVIGTPKAVVSILIPTLPSICRRISEKPLLELGVSYAHDCLSL